MFVRRALGIFGFLWFVLVRPMGRWCRSGSSGMSGCALGADEFFRVRLVCTLEVSGFVRVCLVRAGAP